MVYTDQAPVLTIFPPTPSLFHPPPELNEPQRDRPVTRRIRPRRFIAGAVTARRVEALRPRVTDVDADLVEES